MSEHDARLTAAYVAMQEAKDDAEEAGRILVSKAKDNRKLYKKFMDPHLEGACWEFVRRVCRAERRAIIEAAAYDGDGERESMEGLAFSNGLLDFPLPIPGFPRLGDCEREQVALAAQYYESHAKDMGRKGKWLRLVGQHLTEGARVKDVMSKDRLKELLKEQNNAT